MPFKSAGAAEVLRASQKDESFLEHVKGIIADIFQRLAGTRVWLDIHTNVETACELLYYGLTTLSLRQTLGEEYTGILQVDRSRSRLPSALQRTLMVTFQCLGPRVVDNFLAKLERSTRQGHLSRNLQPEHSAFILQHMPTLRYAVTLLQRLHLANFYLNGLFYHISKRLSGIKYVLLREWFGDNSAMRSFRKLGMVLCIHILLTVLYSCYTSLTSSKAKDQDPGDQIKACVVEEGKRCPLCLDERKRSSVAPCGHLFCWYCIHECLQTSPQCPVCRHPAAPNQIVPLINYD